MSPLGMPSVSATAAKPVSVSVDEDVLRIATTPVNKRNGDLHKRLAEYARTDYIPRSKILRFLAPPLIRAASVL
jgi:hypothetical protein